MLAAGAGTRLRPLTLLRPKPLCPLGDETLLDRALRRAGGATSRLAVNAHHLGEMVVSHVGAAAPNAHLSVERTEALGTAGAIGQLRDWLDGSAALIANGDAFHDTDPVPALVEGWDGSRPRLLVVEDPARGDFGRLRFAGVSLLPWELARQLEPEPSGLYERVWRASHARGQLELVVFDGTFVDCGTASDYLQANLLVTGGQAAVAADADVAGVVERSVVWPGARVAAGERLVGAIRATAGVTVQAEHRRS